MKAGINMWRALRPVKSMHPAWAHLQDKPLTEADLPRAIDAMGFMGSKRVVAPVKPGEEHIPEAL